MDKLSLLLSYGKVNFVLIVGYFLGLAVAFLPIRFAARLKIIYFVLVSSLIFPVLLLLFPQPKIWEPSAQIWSSTKAESLKGTPLSIRTTFSSKKFSPTNEQVKHWRAFGLLSFLLILCLAIGLLRDWYRLQRLIKGSTPLKKLFSVHILLCPHTTVPFAFRSLRTRYVILPFFLIDKPNYCRIAVRHEFQHHRQKDTTFSYLLALIRVIFAVNPFVPLWSKLVSRVQEFACDEHVVGHPRISAQAYGHCLLLVAQQTLRSRSHLAGTTRMATRDSLLTRRIKMIAQKKQSRPSLAWIAGTLSLCGIITAAYAIGTGVEDNRISKSAAIRMAEKAKSSSGFPLQINARVLRQLNRYAGTPGGRRHMRDSLERMKSHKKLIQRNLKKHKLPLELLAVPIMESGYQNLPASRNPSGAAGLWQFMPGTARAYNLKVNEDVDERLDVAKETDAAMRYLSALHLKFQDWGLALLGYNAGEYKVLRGISSTESRNVWTLIEEGFTGDPDYVSKIIAAAILMKNPEVLD